MIVAERYVFFRIEVRGQHDCTTVIFSRDRHLMSVGPRKFRLRWTGAYLRAIITSNAFPASRCRSRVPPYPAAAKISYVVP